MLICTLFTLQVSFKGCNEKNAWVETFIVQSAYRDGFPNIEYMFTF